MFHPVQLVTSEGDSKQLVFSAHYSFLKETITSTTTTMRVAFFLFKASDPPQLQKCFSWLFRFALYKKLFFASSVSKINTAAGHLKKNTLGNHVPEIGSSRHDRMIT